MFYGSQKVWETLIPTWPYWPWGPLVTKYAKLIKQYLLHNSGLYYKPVQGQMAVIFHATILAVKNVRSL
jgi:hypothetical protein